MTIALLVAKSPNFAHMTAGIEKFYTLKICDLLVCKLVFLIIFIICLQTFFPQKSPTFVNVMEKVKNNGCLAAFRF